MRSLFPSHDDWKDGVLARIADERVEYDTPDLLRCDRWVAASLLQKSIRRGETQLALRAAWTLSAFSRSYTWRRLLIIAFEDIGAADVNALIETVAIGTTPKWRSKSGEWERLAYVVSRLAEAPKDRSADYLVSAAESHPSLGSVRGPLLKAPLDGRLRIVGDLSLPLPVRALAAWLLSGIQTYDGPPIGSGDLKRLYSILVELGTNEEFVSSMILAAKRTREPMVVLVPLIWLESRRAAMNICNDEVSASPQLCGIPMYAFDKHTRLGQAAIQQLVQESASIRACLETYVPKPVWRKAAQMAAFYTDGYLLWRRLDWPLSRRLEGLGIESDFCRIGVTSNAVEFLRRALSAELELLNEIRLELWSAQCSS